MCSPCSQHGQRSLAVVFRALDGNLGDPGSIPPETPGPLDFSHHLETGLPQERARTKMEEERRLFVHGLLGKLGDTDSVKKEREKKEVGSFAN